MARGDDSVVERADADRQISSAAKGDGDIGPYGVYQYATTANKFTVRLFGKMKLAAGPMPTSPAIGITDTLPPARERQVPRRLGVDVSDTAMIQIARGA
jgi:hypothetical protein